MDTQAFPHAHEVKTYYTLDQCTSDFERQTIAMLAVLNTQMTTVVGNGQPGRLTKVEDRVSALERHFWKVIGASSACGAIVGVVIQLLPKILGH